MVSPLLLALVAAAHPLHSSVTTVTWRQETRTLELTIRVFTEDLEQALARRGGTACGYVAAAMTLRDAAGNAVPLARCAITDQDDVTWIRLSAAVGDSPPSGLRLANTVLFELFADQINVVQARIGGRSRTVVYTRGDGTKSLT